MKAIAIIGLFLLMLGASGMDSSSLLVPSMMIGAGAALLFGAGRRMV